MYVSYMLRYMRKYRVAVWKFRSVYIQMVFLESTFWNATVEKVKHCKLLSGRIAAWFNGVETFEFDPLPHEDAF